MIDMDEVISMAIKRAEEEGIIFWMKLIKLRAKKDRDRMYPEEGTARYSAYCRRFHCGYKIWSG